jgi:hypothetical protein
VTIKSNTIRQHIVVHMALELSGSARVAIAIVTLALCGGCTDQSQFAIGRQLDSCIGNVPTACTLAAGCVLDNDHYIEGVFPSARRFVARTDGEATIQVAFFFDEQRAPGTELQVTAHEPGCGDRTTWDNNGRDLFRMADANGVLLVPLHVNNPGDHLVEFVSDAYCRYALKLNP